MSERHLASDYGVCQILKIMDIKELFNIMNSRIQIDKHKLCKDL